MRSPTAQAHCNSSGDVLTHRRTFVTDLPRVDGSHPTLNMSYAYLFKYIIIGDTGKAASRVGRLDV